MSRIFKKGDRDPYIAKIQQAINETIKLTPSLKPDGDFGQKSEDALKKWQLANAQPANGIYKDATATVLDAYIERRFLKEQDFINAATVLQTQVACVKAVQEVESKGCGYLPDGRLIILFERHVFKKQLDKLMDADVKFAEQIAVKSGCKILPGQQIVPTVKAHLLRTQPDIYNTATGGYLGGEREYDRMNRAAIFDKGAAQRSASWGLFQIMGYHHALLGFSSIDEMVTNYNANEGNQLASFCNFVKADKRLLTAIRDRNWLAFALVYNGPAQKGYDQRMAAAFVKHS